MSYQITRDYIKKGNARSGIKIAKVRFLVAHDTGNPGSTAYGNRKYFNDHQPSASAQTFIDDRYILEIVPLDEKAWHVMYNKPTDNRMFGDDANDCAIGTELCYGGSIDFNEAYKRYVWYHAHLCEKFNLDPRKHIVSHATLDPGRRTDPHNALNEHGKTWEDFINDVAAVLNEKTVKVTAANDEKVKTADRKEQVKSEVVENGLIMEGDSGSEVKYYQNRLIWLGFPLLRYGADGDFGNETLVAVKAFQTKYGLVVDGIIGTKTKNKFDALYRYDGGLYRCLTPYMRGERVRMIQRRVGALDDGLYGKNTEEKVEKFQAANGLKPDGIVGKMTWSKMF